VPNDQLIRCYDILRMFNVYPWRYIVLAFKFAKSVNKTGNNRNKKRLQYWFFVIDDYDGIANISSVKCTRGGRLSINLYDDRIRSFLLTRTFTTLEEIKGMKREGCKPINVKIYDH